MFKRGGSSFQSQGTGITSPYDTPRKNYNVGAWGVWEDQVRDTTKDKTTTMQDVVHGFSALGNPYKESGEAKTIGEMLFEGSQAVSGARGKRAEGERAGELEILKSKSDRMLKKEERAWTEDQSEIERKFRKALADQQEKLQRDLTEQEKVHLLERIKLEHENKMEQIGEAAKYQEQYLKKEPRNRQKARNRETLLKISQDPKNESSEFIGVYLNELADGYTDGDLASEKNLSQVINPLSYTKVDGKWGYDSAELTVDRVWFDPITATWLVFQDTNGDSMADGAPIYSSVNVEDAITFLKRQPKKEESEGEDEDTPLNDPFAEDEDTPLDDPFIGNEESNIKKVDQNGNVIKTQPDFTYLNKEQKKWIQSLSGHGSLGEADISLEDDPAAKEVELLTRWWKTEMNKTQ